MMAVQRMRNALRDNDIGARRLRFRASRASRDRRIRRLNSTGPHRSRIGRLRSSIVPYRRRLPHVSVIEYGAGRNVFRQGKPADSLFHLTRGKVKLSVTSQGGKEAIVAMLDTGEFFGEGCLAGQQLRIATATSMTDCTLFRIERPLMARLLHEQHEISELFVAHLLSRNIRYEADLVDQLFNSSEKRLARIPLLLSHFGKESREERVLPRVSQDDLAQMVGTTRSRVSHFMNKFRQLGFINYSAAAG